jgi:hypothetical protein
MERSVAIRQLPSLHAVAIRLHDAAADDHTIAVALEIDEDQVVWELRIAQAKLDNLMTPSPTPSGLSRDGGARGPDEERHRRDPWESEHGET